VKRKRVIACKSVVLARRLGGIDSLPLMGQPPHRSAALLDHLARLMRVRAESALAPVGLRPRHLIALTVLRDHGGSTQQALSTTLQIDRTNLVGLLNDLEAANLIERRRSPQDRRRHTVSLTPEGIRRLAEVENALTEAEQRVLAVLDSEQQATLHALLEQVTANGVVCSEQQSADDAVGVDTTPLTVHPNDPALQQGEPHA